MVTTTDNTGDAQDLRLYMFSLFTDVQFGTSVNRLIYVARHTAIARESKSVD